MVGIRTLLRNLAPVVGTHKALPQSVFRVGLAGEDKPGVQASTDLLKFVAHLNNAQHTRCEKVGDDTYVISTLEQGIILLLLLLSHYRIPKHDKSLKLIARTSAPLDYHYSPNTRLS
jgi:hypothetical protein